MALPPQKFREMVFQLLYSLDMGFSNDKDLVDLIMHELAVSRKYALAALERVRELQKHKNEIDTLIAKTAISYEFERIQSVERNILRLGCYELLHDEDIPAVVAIAEAVRLAKKFGSPESASFVNAVLDAIYKCSLGQQVDVASLQKHAEALKCSEQEKADLQVEKPEP